MGRALTNTMINLGIQGECDEAMYQVGELSRPTIPAQDLLLSDTWKEGLFHHEMLSSCSLHLTVQSSSESPKLTNDRHYEL